MSDGARLPAPDRPRGRLLVVGGGIAGLSAAVEAAEAGCDVLLVEREAHLGGRVAQMHQYFPKLCPPLCGLELNLRRVRSGRRLECLTLAEVEQITEFDGGFRAKIRQMPRLVTDGCSACGDCTKVCPIERRNPFDLGASSTKAIFLPHAAAFPARYVIDREKCPGQSCARCVDVCTRSAIDLSMTAREFEVDVRAIVWATGWAPYDSSVLKDLGFGAHPDVITSLMMERLASPGGPTGGRILCPSDGRVPKRVAFVQCAGSRDQSHLDYCSGVCCLASTKQARYVRSAYPEVDISIFYIDRRATGNAERFMAATAADEKVHFIAGKVAKVTTGDGSPVVQFEDVAAGRLGAEHADLVVLATGLVPVRGDTPAFRHLARDGNGFLLHDQPVAGQFPVGCAREPMDVSSAVRDATSAVAKALALCRRD
jgi:quinone-modifying oxidoreductase, subunit QmoA